MEIPEFLNFFLLCCCAFAAGLVDAAALSFFIKTGNVFYAVGIPMAISNVGGAMVGTHLALKKGTGFVRGLFLILVSVLICKLGYEYFIAL